MFLHIKCPCTLLDAHPTAHARSWIAHSTAHARSWVPTPQAVHHSSQHPRLRGQLALVELRPKRSQQSGKWKSLDSRSRKSGDREVTEKSPGRRYPAPLVGGDYWRDTLGASNIIPLTPKIDILRLREGRLPAHYSTAHLWD